MFKNCVKSVGQLFGLGAAIGLALPATAALPGAISGPWYNPAQSGHGLSIDVIEGGEQAVVLWHVFTPDGAPLTLYIDGAVNGRRIEGEAYAPKGMRFGSFDPAALDLPRWGEVSLEFDDCLNARLSWRSSDPAYASGQMAIVKLANLDGVDCRLPPLNSLPVGLVEAEVGGASSGNGLIAEGFIDREGRLWGLLKRFQLGGAAVSVPGPTWVGAQGNAALRAEPVSVDAARVEVETQVIDGYAFWLPELAKHSVGTGQWQTGAVLQGDFAATASSQVKTQRWYANPALAATLQAPVALSDVAGVYRFPLDGQFVDFSRVLEVAADGALCIRATVDTCAFAGTLRDHEGEVGLLHFDLRDESAPQLPRYRGRAWLTESASNGPELVLVGDNGAVGLVLVARPQ